MTLQQHLATISAALQERVDELAATLIARTQREVPGLWEDRDAVVENAFRRSFRDHVARVVHELGHGREPAAGLAPSAVEEVQAAVRARIAIDDLLHTRRVAHAVIWEALMEDTHRMELATATRIDLMKLVSRFLFADVDSVLPLLRAAYERERSVHVRGRDHRRDRLVHDLLAGAPVDAADLGYDLHARHLCAVAWGAAPDATIEALAEAVGGRELLLVAGGDRSLRAWLIVPPGPCDPALVLSPESSCAVGEPADGVDGFRATYRQADSAYRIGLRRSPGSVTRYRDVALEALTAADEVAARDFVAYWMGSLVDDDPRMGVLRATLSAYFAAGHNALAAAARLGVNDRTVAYRLRTIEERLLGVPIASRRDELAIALRLYTLVGKTGS